MSIEGIVGVGIGVREGRECIIVFVRRMDEKVIKSIPKDVNGYKIYIKEVGELIKF